MQSQNGPSYLTFWGKAQPDGIEGARWHPAALHCLDVGAVATLLLRTSPAFVANLIKEAGWLSDSGELAIVFLVGLHDLGKFSRAFQRMALDHWPAVLGDATTASNGRHDAMTAVLLLDSPELAGVLEGVFPGWRDQDVLAVVSAIAGHHGRPAPMGGATVPTSALSAACRAAAAAFAADWAALIAPSPLPPPPLGWAATASWSLAGLVTLCDWIGSARNWFPYEADRQNSLELYWPIALERAEAALRQSGLLPVESSVPRGIAGLLPNGTAPTPMQRLAERIDVPAGAVTVLIEDATGSGKTEAALVLAHRLMARGQADGLFIALPTMATSDAIYARLTGSYRALFTAAGTPSLALAHGRAGLNEHFRSSIQLGAKVATDISDGAGESASAQCSAWIADEKRRSFFAHVGTGTIDQALLGVLPARHAALRLFGLSRRVLIVDEAHSYDAYMSQEMERLLTFHRLMGGSSIVLSATLPHDRRAALLGVADESWTAAAYPLLSISCAGEATQHLAGMRLELVRSLPVRRATTAQEAADHLIAAARAGACGIWIRNTVADAVAGADLLREQGFTPLLFHARFAMGDRLAAQGRVLEVFGKRSTSAERAPGGLGQMLVATQVVEQSLDLDADVMVSDLAPVDLLIQRAGRLQRHPERHRPNVPLELLVVSPAPVGQPAAAWANDPAIGGSRFVYAAHVLWRSARALFAAGAIEVPGNLRQLVEAVYGDEGEAVPPGLAMAESIAEGERLGEMSLAQANLLDPALGYCRQNGAWEPDTVMPTRLGANDRLFRMAREDAGELVPFCADRDPRRAWALSEISIRRSWVTEAVVPAAWQAALARLLAGWTCWEREIPVLIVELQADGYTWNGKGLRLTQIITISYNSTRGLSPQLVS